jgi:hypothetical protein
MRSASPNLDTASTHPVLGACGGGRGREGGGVPVVWRDRLVRMSGIETIIAAARKRSAAIAT